MERRPERKSLGRGLSALMADVNLSPVDGGNSVDQRGAFSLLVSVERIRPNPDQPRRDFDPQALQELADSIKSKGVIQPIVVRQIDGGPSYEIVAGERRWRAAQMAQLHSVPVVVREFSDSEVIEIAIIENVQRSDLNAVEEALGFRQLMDRFGHTQEKLASALSKSRSHIANTLRLLNLPDDVQMMIRTGKLTAGHARALIGASDAKALALRVVNSGLSVRETEKLAKAVSGKSRAVRQAASSLQKDADTRAIEADLSANLGMIVQIDHGAAGDGGTLQIRYRTLDDLDLLCQFLSASR